MANRLVERIHLKTIQRHHHQFLNNFGDNETMIEAISARPGFFGANPVGYLSLFARRCDITIKDIDEAILVDKNMVRTCAFRGGLFFIPTEDFPLYFRALFHNLSNRSLLRLQSIGYDQHQLNKLWEVLNNKANNWPLTFSQIKETIFTHKNERPNDQVINIIVQHFCDLGLLLRANAKGWRGNDFTFVPTKKWLPDVLLKSENADIARTETIRRYIHAYGPCTVEDISWWTGLSSMQVQRSISNIKREIMRFSVESYKDDMVALKEDAENIRKKIPSMLEISLLPPWDPYTFGWKCKRRIADKEFLPYIFDHSGNAASVIVDNGKIIGLWQFRNTDTNIIEYHIFLPFIDKKRYVLEKINQWADNIALVTGINKASITENALPDTLLNERPPGSFLWPLGKPVAAKKQMVDLLTSPMERRNTFRQPYLDNGHLIRQTLSEKNTQNDPNNF